MSADDFAALAAYTAQFRGETVEGTALSAHQAKQYIIAMDEYDEYWADVWQWRNCIVRITGSVNNVVDWITVRFGSCEHTLACPTRFLVEVDDAYDDWRKLRSEGDERLKRFGLE